MTKHIMKLRGGTAPERSARSALVFKVLSAGLLVGAALASIGCAQVMPYERAKLAHPTMTAVDLVGPGVMHLRAIDEGATGGSAGAGSGCGCN
ncbi:MAG: DUF4266 domain-containing protein [Polyangiaceae bacterium]